MKLRIALVIFSCALSIVLALVLAKGQIQPLTDKVAQIEKGNGGRKRVSV